MKRHHCIFISQILHRKKQADYNTKQQVISVQDSRRKCFISSLNFNFLNINLFVLLFFINKATQYN
jgi:hypothetical protein